MQAMLLVSNIVLVLLVYGGSIVTGQCGRGEVRLNSGSDFGRVEVCINGTWGTLCDDFWDNDDASVVCRQLGFSPFGAIGTTGSYTEGSLPMHIIDLNCTGSELSVLDCPHNGLTGIHACDHRQDASVRCQAVGATYSNCSDGEIRLMGGLTDYQGRVEICINNLWGTICYSSSRYNYWDINDARVVCRNLGHQELGIAVYQTATTFFGQGSGPVFLTNVHCSGSEMSLLECPRTVFVGTACTHGRDVGLRCQPHCLDGSVRILTSSESLDSTYYGRVEVCVNGTWGTICSDFWENKDASVVCRQLGYSEYGAVSSRGLYTETVWPFHIIDLNCTGVERMILECSHNGLFDEYNCPSRNDASLRCQTMQITSANCSDGDVRLVDGLVDYEGRVEICVNQVWGTVCSTTYRNTYSYYIRWDVNDAKVVCRQLGHQELGATLYTSSSTFGAGTGPVFLSDLYCDGSEANLLECRNYNFVQLASTDYCTHSRDVGLRCEPICSNGAVRLASSAQSVDSVLGRVEVCVNGTWGTICSDFWENLDASVVCKQLGYSEYGAVAGRGLYTETIWPFHIIDLNCTGEERAVWECSHNGLFDEYNCPSRNDASVRCQAGDILSANCSDGDVRLVDGSVYYEGRVEICINRVWGTVCSTTYRNTYSYYIRWDVNDAKIVCRQLGHQELGATVYTSSSTFGAGTGPVLLSDLRCVGSEANLLACPNSNFLQLGSNDYCTHSRDVGLKCELACSNGAIRVVSSANDVNSSIGRVEVCVNGTWGTICSDFWENEDASVVCKQVGFSEYGALAGRGSFAESVWPFHIIDLNCTGGERTVWECPHNNLQSMYSCASRNDASVICQAIGITSSNCSDGDVRLVDGLVDYEGRVEICVNQVWGTVCSTTYRYTYSYYIRWDVSDAKVVCRQLGHQELGAVVYTTSSTFGPGNGPVFLSDIHCTGSEEDLLECRNTLFVGSYCTHGRDVGVRCEAKCASGTIRLVSESNSYFRSYGRVELCINETWTTVCDEHWNDVDASVVCHQLGYSRYGAIANSNNFIENIWPVVVTNISCTGSEETLLQCVFSTEPISACNQRSDASVLCQSILTVPSNCTSGKVRLSGEVTSESGRLEVCINNAWGTVCNNNWDVHDARVACRELGFQQFYGFTVGTSSSNYAGIGIGPVYRYRTSCSGSEPSFSQCNSVKYPSAGTSCNHYDDVTLQCIVPCNNGDIRLYGSSVDRAGVVHVCVNGTWGKVCGGELNPEFASIVCSQLGYSPFGAIATRGLWSDNYYIYHMYHPECYGNESNILECPYSKQDTVPSSCNQRSIVYYHRYYRSNYDVTSVICLPVDGIEPTNCTDGDIRLVGEFMIPHTGRLEICQGQVWGTICRSRGFSTTDANTICRSLGYQSYGSSIFSTPTSKYNPPMFADFDCSSTSFDLSHCSNPSGIKSSVQSCGPSVIGIQCVPLCEDREVRLVGGYGYGRVEVCGSGLWGTVCSDEYWDYIDAGVICKQLGFSNYGALALSNWYTEREKIGLFHSVECNGTEESIFDCRTNEGDGGCGTYQDASVICHVAKLDYNDCTTGDVRLVDGPSPNKGRVEVCINHAWASICSSSFDREEAIVVCGQLGYLRNGVIIRGGSYYGQSSGPIVRYFSCRGTENSLFECNTRYLTNSLSCNHNQDVGLDCELPCVNGSVRLAGSPWNYQGRVEVCVNNTWGTICTNFWDTNDTAVVCRQLGFSSSDSRIYNGYRERYWPLHIIDINCTGEESTIWDCPHNAVVNSNCRSYYQDAAVTCAVDVPTCTTEEEGDLRLVDGVSVYEGRVEVCTNREWGTICQRNWNNQEAMVVCRQLGFHTDGAIATTRYQYGSGIIHFDAFGCVGDEVNILSCPHSHPVYYCSHSTDAGVICRGPCSDGDVQLIGDSRYNNFGRVEICINGSWGKVCSDMWENNDAGVVCRQLGFSPFGAITRLSGYQQPALKYHILSANCLDDETSILNCPYTLMQPQNMCSSSAGVICQESIPESASVSSNCTNYDVRFEPDGTPDQNRGKLQMCFGGVWGAICTSNGLLGRSAEVICDQLGFQRRGSATYTVGFDLHSDLLTIRQISCSGNEPNVSQCSVQFYTQLASCSHRSVTALQCVPKCRNGDVRITGSSFTRLGRVEVCINSTWGTICDDYWDNSDASVVCKQLGYSPYGAIAIHNSFTETIWPVHIYDLNCTGLENTFQNCPHNALNLNLCNHRQDAAVSCLPTETSHSNCTNGDLRVDSMEPDETSGRLEICDNGVWFSVYRSSSWTSYYSERTRNFACQSLGYGSIDATVYPIYYLDQSFRHLYPLDFSCPSTITSFLRNCARNYHSSEYQSSTLYEVGIRCTSRSTECDHGQIQLIGSGYKQIGRVEVCINGTWGTICDDFWNNTDASVVCRHLGYSPHGAIALSGFYTERSRPTLIHDLNCTGTEESLFDCPFNALINYPCYRYDDAAIVCQDAPVVSDCIDGDIRLINGPTPQEGTVEICVSNVWGGICQGQWGSPDANVACSQLGYQPVGATAIYNSFFGTHTTTFHMTNVGCSGTERRLMDCRHSKLAVTACGDGQYAGVRCLEACEEGSVRVRGPRNSRFGGRVEVCVELSWTTVCDTTWDNLDASVICFQLGFSRYGAVSTFGLYTEGQLSFGITDIHCNGTEDNFTSCTHNEASLHNCQPHDDAGVICQGSLTPQSQCIEGDVRLVGGYGNYEGRVEVCINQAWGTVCDNNWDDNDANVVCGQLGFLQRGSIARQSAYFGMGNGPILLADLFCSGLEESLLDCNRNTFGTLNCAHFEDAGVTCEIPCTDGEIRLRGASVAMIGRVEVCVNGTWGTVCDEMWDNTDASVVCKQLGFSPYGSIALFGRFSDSVWPTFIHNIECIGNEESIWQCPHLAYQDSLCGDSSVVCQDAATVFSNCSNGEVRLVGGNSENEGRVEVCLGNTWGTLCDDGWNYYDANIVCRQLGYQPFGAVAYSRAYFGQGSGPILLSNVQCVGTETSLIDCYWSAHNIHTCLHSEDAGVMCQGRCTQGSVRTSGTNSDRYGAVEVCVNGTWGTVCNDFWDDLDARVFCRQLGYSPYGALSSNDFSSVLQISLMNVSCLGNEDSLLHCEKTFVPPLQTTFCSTKAGVLCQASSTFADCENGDVRLAGGSHDYQGRVEVCISSAWGTVCDRNWDLTEGNMICLQLGFQPFGATPLRNAPFGRGQFPIILGGLSCSGQERSLLECNRNDNSISTCHVNQVASLQCEELCNDGDVRISGGPTALIGRVEVCVNRTWGTVCEDTWNDRQASVVCHQLDHSMNGAISGTGGFPVVGRPSYMSGVACNGNETSLFQCTHSIEILTECPDNSIAGVVCQASSVVVSNCNHGDIRLTGSRKRTEGRVEVCIHGVWGTACDDGWDALDANVVCGQLGFYPFGAEPRYGTFYGEAVRPMIVADLFCSGTESDLLSCERNVFGITHCQEYEAAGIKCLGSFPISLSKRAGSLLGGDSIIVSGLSLLEDDEIICVFDQTEVEGIYINETQALCITPAAKEETFVNFKTTVRRGSVNITGGALYQYISPENEEDIVGIEIEQKIVWNGGEMANITWRPSSLIMNELIDNVNVKVDASLLIYNEETEELEQTMMLATDLPNTGFAQVQLPTSPIIPTSQYDVHAAILQLSVNTSTTVIPVTKRAAHQSRLGRLLRWAKKFTKARIISYIQTSIARRLLCEVWVAATPRFPQRSIPPCPCTTSDAAGDDRYVEERYDNKYADAALGLLRRHVLHKGSSTCYRQANVRDFGPGQQCCYRDDGTIITGNNGGTADLIAPTNWKTTILHFLVDVYPWILCCTGLFKDCSRYTSRRPVDDCSEWPERPPPARMFGDPHIVTLDGYQYTFNGKGEFILSETPDGSFILQGRMTEPPLSSNSNSTSRGTSFVSLAIKEDDSPTVQLEIVNNEPIVLVDGERVDFTAVPEQRFSNVTISDVGNSTYSIRFASGASLIASEINNILTNILITLPEHYITRGLLGQYNGDPNDDLLPRNTTTPLPANANIEDIHYSFGITWIINNPRQSIFTYGPSGDWETFHHPEYNPAFAPNFSNPILEEQAHDVCGNDNLCLFDIAATGNVDIGSSTMDSVQQQEILQTQFVQRVCNPPCLNGACVRNNTCSCSDGYIGSRCETEVTEECDVDICENGAVCKQLAGDYICECSPEFTGALCENKVETPSPVGEPTTNLAVIVGSVVGGLLFVVIMVTVVACLTCCMICRNKKIDDQLEEKRYMEMKVITNTATLERVDPDEQ